MSVLLTQIKSKVSDVRAEIWQLRLILADIDKYLQDHRNPYDLMVSARDQVEAAKDSLAEFDNFVATNKTTMDSIDIAYSQHMLDTLGNTIAAHDSSITLPTISPTQIENQLIVGKVVNVEDGDTYTIEDENGIQHNVRMAGIDAPELGCVTAPDGSTKCVTENGIAAKKGLSDMIMNKKIETYVDKHNPLDMYRRVLGTPKDPTTGKNITEEMVRRCLTARNTKFGKNIFVDQAELEIAGLNCVSFPGWGILHIYSRPTNAAIWIDGEDAGVVAPDKIPLPIGEHEISVVFPGKATHIETRYIGPGETQVRVDLEDSPATLFSLEVRPINPRHPRVFIDDVDQGYAPIITSLDSDIKHTITLSADGYEDYEEEITSQASDRKKIEPDMTESK